jgi:23S rRNA G2069 N7-methylase RlmK/C1962 C5-methylase RlmI
MTNDFDLKRDHAEIITQCVSLLNPGGTLYFSANAKGFKLDPRLTDMGGARLDTFSIADITESLRDEDFKGKRIPLAWTIRRSG